MSLQMPAPTPVHKPSPTRPRQKYSAARAFYLTFLLISAIAILSLLKERRTQHEIHGAGHALLSPSPLTVKEDYLHGSSRVLVRRDQACRLVHSVKDQCAFVRANCPDEEAGLFSYLQLYYCKLHKARPFAFILLMSWLGLLFSTIGIAASDFFCINLSTISSILGMSESMAGVTFLAFGNGSPDVFSTFAAMKTNSGSLAVGELIGAAGFITAVVAGSMALVRPFKVARKSFVRDVGFFIVAASFSMVFLADGHLHLWECAVMVAFYVFYVATVVCWHWYLRRRSRRRLLEDAARGNFSTAGADEVEHEPYHDEDDENTAARSSRAPTRTVSADDFANLERGGSPMLRPLDEEADADDQTRDRYLAEISSNMRVSRRKPGERRNTINPIRPSLVGALEFRAVLSSLQKSRNIQTIPINLRRYSDDPSYTLAQQQDNLSSISNPDINHYDVDAHDVASNTFLQPIMDGERTGQNRVRAVSANDAEGLRFDPSTLQNARVPEIDLLGATPPGRGGLQPSEGTVDYRPSPMFSSQAPSLSLSPAAEEFGYLSTSPAPMSPLQRGRTGELLAPPDDNLLGSRNHAHSRVDTQQDDTGLPIDSPKLIGKPSLPRIQIPRSPSSQSSRGSSPCSQFPALHDDPTFLSLSRTPSLRLPPSSIGSESTFRQNFYQEPEDKPMRWWPYKVLPPPRILVSTLFPTLYSWGDKNIWEKLLGVVAAPSVFLLAITLPVVEVDKEEEGEELPGTVDPDPGLLSPHRSRSRSTSIVIAALPPDSPPTDSASNDEGSGPPKIGKHRKHGTRSPSINIVEPEDGAAIQSIPKDPRPLHPPSRQPNNATKTPSPAPPTSSAKEWNRWLVVTQIFTGPLLIVVLLWANTDPSLSPRNLLLPCLYALIASLVTFAILILTTTPSHAPKYRYLLCFFGFIVSIAWISTIANEVVGVLKAFGVILGISDAILGLTIFAVGNSLGDLVADITVARLGYPVMALSACFGGPMLNILLGIGLSGLYMTIQKGERRHEKHPGRPIRYKPYQIEVGGTLLISGVMLLVTLAGLLVVVPLRGWWMDRRVGWGLVALWCASTIGNVAVEIVGWGRES